MGAVRCQKHGTHVAGPFCCDHVRNAVYATSPIPFGIYRGDLLGDGTMIVPHYLCAECASTFGLSVDEVVPEQILSDAERFPYVCPVCAQCFAEWTKSR